MSEYINRQKRVLHPLFVTSMGLNKWKLPAYWSVLNSCKKKSFLFGRSSSSLPSVPVKTSFHCTGDNDHQEKRRVNLSLILYNDRGVDACQNTPVLFGRPFFVFCQTGCHTPRPNVGCLILNAPCCLIFSPCVWLFIFELVR